MKHKEKIMRLQINMSSKALEELNKLQKEIDSSTKTEVVKSSLKLFRFLVDEKHKKSKIIIREESGKEKEIIF